MLKYHPQQFLMKGLFYSLMYLVRKDWISLRTMFRIMYVLDTALTTAHEYLHFFVAYIMKFTIGLGCIGAIERPVISRMRMEGQGIYFGKDSYCKHAATFLSCKNVPEASMFNRVFINMLNIPLAISELCISLAPFIPTLFLLIYLPVWISILFTVVTLGNLLPSAGDLRKAGRSLLLKF